MKIHRESIIPPDREKLESLVVRISEEVYQVNRIFEKKGNVNKYLSSFFKDSLISGLKRYSEEGKTESVHLLNLTESA